MLIDGFDLLSPICNQFEPYWEICDFIKKYSSCKFIVSTRPDFIDNIKNDFKEYKLEKLTDEKIKIFIERRVGNSNLKLILLNKILNDQQLQLLLRNPMLLYLAIEVAKDRQGKKKDLLPSNRPELYSSFVSGLFYHYEKTKGKTLCSNRVQIKNALKEFYFKLQCSNEISLDYDKAWEIVEKHTKEPNPKCILEDCFRLGLLTKRDSKIKETKIEYGIHQSFQEYFAALKLKELFENGFDISVTFGHPKWEEVVIFVSEMLDLDSVDEFIDLMISKGELFLASKCAKKASNNLKEKLCALLADKMDSKYILEKQNSLESLARIGNNGISIIAEAIKDKDVRWKAAYMLKSIGSETAVQALINILNDKNIDVRKEAVESLGKIGSETAVQPLINRLNDKDRDVRKSVIESLGKIESEKAVQPLINTLYSKDEDMQRIAAEAIETIGSKKAVQPLIEELNDKDRKVRISVIKSLEKIGSETAVQALINILNDKNIDVGGKAAESLGQIGSEKAFQPLINALNSEYQFMQWKVKDALKKVCSVKNEEQLEDFLRTENKFLINFAFEILSEFKNGKRSKIVLSEKQFQYKTG